MLRGMRLVALHELGLWRMFEKRSRVPGRTLGNDWYNKCIVANGRWTCCDTSRSRVWRIQRHIQLAFSTAAISSAHWLSGMTAILCHACLSYHEPRVCNRNWQAPCRCCERPRGPGSEAGEDVCGRCYGISLHPTLAFVSEF